MPRNEVDRLKDRIDELESENEILQDQLDSISDIVSGGRRGRGRRRGGGPKPACGSGWRKEANQVTDLRLRQRANECRPAGKNCLWCGATERLMVAHIDGNESNSAPYNFGPTCRSGNAKIAHVMRSLGMGRRAREYNPSGQRARTLAQWLAAVMSMKGESDQMPVGKPVQMIHATPAEDRSEFARQIWRLRRTHGRAGTLNSDEIPFWLPLHRDGRGRSDQPNSHNTERFDLEGELMPCCRQPVVVVFNCVA
jgi:hypothetical protein